MAHKHKPHRKRRHSTRHRSAKQIAATKKWNAAGRRAAAHKKRSAKQISAARHNLVKARAVRRHMHIRPHHGHKATAPVDISSQEIDYLPICAAVAFAESIYYQSGIIIPDANILAIHRDIGITSIADLAEYSTVHGFAGYRLESYYPCDEEQYTSGLVYGLHVPTGYHAALAMEGGLLCWGTVYPLTVRPSEAWLLLWTKA